MIDVTKPIRRKGGTVAEHHGVRSDGAHIVSVKNLGGAWADPVAYSSYSLNLHFENVPERTERWANVYEPDAYCSLSVLASQGEANCHAQQASHNRLGLIKLVYSAGRLLADECEVIGVGE